MREGAADGVVRGVQRRIVDDRLAVGYRIGTKAEVGRAFDVSPATLGEALRVLRTRGVVDVRPGPGGGVFVAAQPPLLRLAETVTELRRSGASANDVAAVIDGLDAVVVRDAAVHRTAGDLRELDNHARLLAQAFPHPEQRPAATWGLHRRIAEISPNPVLRALYLNLVDHLGEALDERDPASGFDPDAPDRLQVHLDMVEAIRSRHADQVDDVLRRHRHG